MKEYSFLENELLINGVPISGFAEGDDVITFSRRVDQVSDVVGADGEMSIAISADKSGVATVRLQQTSSSNALLGAIVNAVDAGVFVPVTVQSFNTGNGDIAAGTKGYIRKPADMTRGTGINSQDWELVVEKLYMLTGVA